MADRKSIFANVSSLAAGQAIAMALGFATHAILARAVGPANYGLLGFATAIISYFGIAASLGTDTWASREIASHRSRVREIVESTLTLRLLLSVLAFGGVLILLAIWQPSFTVATMIVIQAAGLFVTAIGLDFAFQGVERMDAVARRQVLTAVVALAGVAAAINLGGDIVAASVALQAAAALSATVMLWEFSRAFGRPHLHLEALSQWRGNLREAAPLAVTVLLVTVYTYIDIVMLGFMRPGAEVGHYVAATRVLTIGLVFAAILRTAILPVLARLQSSPTERREAGEHHAKLVTAAGGLAAAGGFVLAPDILEIIFGSEFRGAGETLRILMVCLLLMNAVEVYHTQLVAWRLQSQQMWIMIAGALFNIVLNIFLIPRYGMNGAASATLASTLLILILAGTVLRRYRFETHGIAMLSTLSLAALLAIAGRVIEVPIDGAISRFIVIGLALTGLYTGAILALRIVRPRDTIRYFTRT